MSRVDLKIHCSFLSSQDKTRFIVSSRVCVVPPSAVTTLGVAAKCLVSKYLETTLSTGNGWVTNWKHSDNTSILTVSIQS